jgi:hypothetical protein
MISIMRPSDIDHADESARNTTARAFSMAHPPVSLYYFLPQGCLLQQKVVAGVSHRHLNCSPDRHYDEECPNTVSSIIAAEGVIANVVDMTQMNPRSKIFVSI